MAVQGFSSALKLTDLDDFINPSQDCVMPVKINKEPKKTVGSAVVSIESDGSYHQLDERGQKLKLEKAKITLSDCLACSGCVTSAETVLLAQQSQMELFRVLEENGTCVQGDRNDTKLVVVSLSPQSRASIAAHYHLSAEEASSKLVAFFKGLGVDYVFDTTFARDFSLIESCREFVRRYKSTAIGQLPMLSSACPGWICYAEKTHGDFVLPYISRTKSPQQVIGSLVKDYFAKTHNKKPDEVYHVTIMPCFDKKLEASRRDFYDEVQQSKDVDCVLTTGEVEEMLQEKKVDLATLPSQSFDKPLSGSGSDDHYVHSGGGSGGYLEAILKYSAKELFGLDVQEISYRSLRNKDLKEVTICNGPNPVLRFAAAYGFRNIQNLMQKLKRGKCNYHFVEIMACPSGCLNGGGQLHVSLSDELSKQMLHEVERVYTSVKLKQAEENATVIDLYRDWLQGAESGKCYERLHTDYHHIEKPSSSLSIKW